MIGLLHAQQRQQMQQTPASNTQNLIAFDHLIALYIRDYK
jgi:hypothetical protein